MELIYPQYYESFSCLAGKCPDSCCKEWDVDVDPAAAAYYRQLPGSLGTRLRQVLQDTEDGTVMTIENGRCPMWREDGLCRIQAELGHNALCHVCREFPRLRHDYGTFVELGLELSCPEAARLILTVSSAPQVVQQVPSGDTPDYDENAMQILLHSRKTAHTLLSNPQYTIPQALILLYFHAHNTQTLLDGEEPPLFQPDNVLSLAEKVAADSPFQPIIDLFLSLEILTPEWRNRLHNPVPNAPWTDAYRNLAGYFVDRYWLQAVSDFDLLCRVKFILVACLLLHNLGGNLLRTAQLFSKEIENSDENFQTLLDAAYENPALTDVRLFGALLNKTES